MRDLLCNDVFGVFLVLWSGRCLSRDDIFADAINVFVCFTHSSSTLLSILYHIHSSDTKHDIKWQTPNRSWQDMLKYGVATISRKLQVSFAKEPYKRDDILQKRRRIGRSLLIVATPYTKCLTKITLTHRHEGNRHVYITYSNSTLFFVIYQVR